MSGPLHGVRILDVGTAGVGPWAATLLGFLGADVVKIEPPDGDQSRPLLPFQRGISTIYTAMNLNKRSAIIDLKDPDMRPSVDRMVGQADVIMDNLRPGAVDRMGLGFEPSRAINPQIISASSRGWGDHGPMRELPAVDPQVQVFSGFASLNGPPGGEGEMLRTFNHMDFNASCYFGVTVVLALIARERTGQAQRVTASHLGSAVTLMMTRLAEYLTTGKVPLRLGSGCAATVPHQYFRCRDNRHLALAVQTEEQWRRFCKAIQREDLLEDKKFNSNRKRVEHRDLLIPLLDEIFATRPTRWWALRLEDQGVPHGLLLDFDQLRFHEQIKMNGFLTQINPPHQGPIYVGTPPWGFGKTPAAITIEGAVPGAHTEEVLTHGFGDKNVKMPRARANGNDTVAPLTGYKVIDATQGYAGPFAALLLADAGADVIKVEPPEGDYSRQFAPAAPNSDSALFVALNRNKRSIALDLTSKAGQQEFRTLAKSADILLEDWGPGIADARGLGFANLKASNPELIYCALSDFGEKGPLKDQPGSEIVIQAWTEYWKNLSTLAQEPQRVGADIVGQGTGVMAALAILAGVYHRLRSGEGQRIAISLLGTMMCLRTLQWAAVTNPDTWEGYAAMTSPIAEPLCGYRTKDRPIYFNLHNATEEQFITLLQKLEMLDEVIEDPRFGNAGRDVVGLGKDAEQVWYIWEKHLQRYGYQEVLDIMNQHGCAANEACDLEELMDHPQVQSLDLMEQDSQGRRYMRAPWIGPWKSVPLQPPPSIDQQREGILAELKGRPQAPRLQ